MTVQWYIPEPKAHHDADNAQRLVYILQEMGSEVFCNTYVPFGGMDYSFLSPERPAVLFGHLGVVKDVQNRMRWQQARPGLPNVFPFIWCDFGSLKCSSYYVWYGQHIAQQRYGFYPLAEVKRLRNFIFDTFGFGDDNRRVFIRPDDNNKVFNGELVAIDRFDSFIRQTIDDSGPDCLCLASMPLALGREWRLVMLDGKVLTASQYKNDRVIESQHGCPPEVAAKAEEIIKSTGWQPHPVFVMDMAEVGRPYNLATELRVMEIGSINVAGLYACDLRAIAKGLNELAEREFAETRP